MSPPAAPEPLVPDYEGACLSGLMPALLARPACPTWVPAVLARAPQVVLLVLDGLGWCQFRDRLGLAPTLAALDGRPITTVVPSTTSAALTSLTTGTAPAEHGLVGHRMRLLDLGILDCLRWTVGGQGDARLLAPPATIQPIEPFAGTEPVIVTRAGFDGSGFSDAHLRGGRYRGWKAASTLPIEIRRALDAGDTFVYAYYDGVDQVAHQCGLDERYDAEIAAVDRLVASVVDALPPGAALAVTADHGHVDVGEGITMLDHDLLHLCAEVSGEARFRWLTAKPGAEADLEAQCREQFSDVAWVRTRDEVVASGWMGPKWREGVADRLGGVVLAAYGPTAFAEAPHHPVSHHGSLTEAEVLVPLLVATG